MHKVLLVDRWLEQRQQEQEQNQHTSDPVQPDCHS